MKKIKITLLLLFTLSSVFGIAQKNERKQNHRVAKADSIFIVKLKLTDAEQKAFLPVFHEFVKAKKENRKKYLPSEIKGKQKMKDLSDEELEKILDRRFEFNEADIKIKKSYHEKFKKVLPIKKLAKFYQIEKRLFKRKKERRKRKK